MNNSIQFNLDWGRGSTSIYSVAKETTMAELIKKIKTDEKMKGMSLHKLLYAGCICSDFPDMKVGEKITPGGTVHLMTIPHLSVEEWLAMATRNGDVLKICANKPIATPDSGAAPRDLTYNWNRYNDEQKRHIEAQLSTANSGNIKIATREDAQQPIHFYSQQWLETLLSIISIDRDQLFDRLSQPIFADQDPEMISLIYIMFGDLAGLGWAKVTAEDLTDYGKEVYEAYLNATR